MIFNYYTTNVQRILKLLLDVDQEMKTQLILIYLPQIAPVVQRIELWFPVPSI